MTVGQWDPELFARFRAATGPLRRMLLDRLIRENEPLIKLLVDQLCGFGKQRARTRLGGCQGMADIPWDDAMQAGRMAFCKAAEQFDPSKGKISFYLLVKIRYELQRITTFELDLARVPRGKEDEKIPLALVGEQADLDAMSTGSTLGGLAEIDGITPEMIRQWEETGEWPELEEWEERKRAVEAPAVISIPTPRVLSPLEKWLDAHCVFAAHARTGQWELWNAWRNDKPTEGAANATAFAREIVDLVSGVRETKVRRLHRPVRGLGGIRLRGIASVRGYA